MEVKINKDEEKEIEFEVIGEKTLLNPLKNKLLEYEEVEFAEWRVEHPLIGNPEFYLRVKKGKARDFLKKAIEELKNELKELLNQLEE
ncbi:MAG: DNA-directed RNA polymerase subunit L [Thermoplasmata archaeon]|nr:MAG: DNA-directed RNA polymerase subunit L [Thermoplasmata archaeon]MCD6573374.1 DNA-directed RNA polymerase subunit L [Thermoplasmata archaeon]